MCSSWIWRGRVFLSLAQEQDGEIIGSWGEMVERIIKSMPSPSTDRTSMTEEEPKAFRIVGYENATVPQPSAYLYNALALRGWNDYREQMEEHVGHDMPTWDELPNHLKAVWIGIARGQHGVMAWLGGGTIEEIDAD